MPILEHAAMFCGCPIKDFRRKEDWSGPDASYRLRIDRDAEAARLEELLETFVIQADVGQLKALVIGTWGGESNVSSFDVMRGLIRHRDRFTNLTAIFLGDIIHRETEISRIQNSDVGPLLNAFPKLEILRVRGGQGLRISRLEHQNLRALIVETGGFSRFTLRDLMDCNFPSLGHLELWLGARNHGWNATMAGLQPILNGARFPKLKHLGLRNSEIVNEIARAIVSAPVLSQLHTLDLSLGNLSDPGGRALMGVARYLPLQILNLSHHYLSPSVLKALKMKLRCKVIADDARPVVDDQRQIFASE
jgi:hypothetical protein